MRFNFFSLSKYLPSETVSAATSTVVTAVNKPTAKFVSKLDNLTHAAEKTHQTIHANSPISRIPAKA